MYKYARNEYSDRYKEYSFMVKDAQYNASAGRSSIKTKIWDTSEVEAHRSTQFNGMLYKNLNAFIVVFGVDNRQSFQNAQHWLYEIVEFH